MENRAEIGQVSKAGGREMKIRAGIATLVALAACVVMAPSRAAAQQADMILYNGKILTVDSNFTIAQAVAISGNKIAATGADQAILAMAGPNTQKIDLKG